MKKLFALLLMTMTIVAFGAQESKAASANITNLYTQHNQFYNGNKGMYIKFDFGVSGQRGKSVKAVVTLYKSNGKKLYYYNGSAVTRTITNKCGYDTTYFNGWWMFTPYSTINLPSGRTDCYALVQIYGGSGKLLASRKVSFWISR